jgi:ABC-type transport system substrate-binding protein
VRGGRWVALLVAVVLASSCTSGDDDDDDGGDDTESPAADPGASTESDQPPVEGGRLVIGTDGEPDGFNPTVNRFTVTGLTYANAVFDPLLALDADGEVVPFLAESITHDDQHLLWTVVLRAGVVFSDGSPLNAGAVVRTFEAHLASELTRGELRELESVSARDDRTVEFRMARPWVRFPIQLTGRLGLIAAPAMLDDPASRVPIGTGPFVLREWLPGDRMVLARNPTHWRAGLPHLDEVELRPLPDLADRVAALARGDVDVITASEPKGVDAIGDLDDIGTATIRRGAIREHRLVFNTAVAPFDDLGCRQAVADAVDPDLDLDPPDGDGCDFTYLVGPSPLDAELAETARERLEDAGIEMTIEPSARATVDALLGEFQAVGLSFDGVVDPDERIVDIDPRTSGPVGTLARNVSRFDDPDLEAAITEARSNGSDDAYEAVDDLVAAALTSVRMHRSPWAYGFRADLGGVLNGLTLPGDGVARARPGVLLLADLHTTA